MSTPPMPVWSVRLVDDAAVFPPGLSPVGRAWRDHQQLRRGPYAECVGPLLLAPGHVAGLVLAANADRENHEAGQRDSAGQRDGDGDGGALSVPPVSVRVIGRAGTPFTDLDSAIQTLGAMPGVQTAGLEISYGLGWTATLQHGLPLAVEVSRKAAERDPALDEIALARAEGRAVIAKLRTQATESAPVPTAAELAGFVIACRQRDLPFKLTGGLHHAVASGWVRGHARNGGLEPMCDLEPEGDGEPQPEPEPEPEPLHGVVNVLLATHAARNSASTAEVEQILVRTDALALAESLQTLTSKQQRDLRADFTSYGCCGVLDPLTELTALDLLPTPNPEDESV